MSRLNWNICGRFIGTATGWDQNDTFDMQVYELEPVEGFNVPPGDYSFSFETGLIHGGWDKEGQPTIELDLVDTLKNLEIRRTS